LLCLTSGEVKAQHLPLVAALIVLLAACGTATTTAPPSPRPSGAQPPAPAEQALPPDPVLAPVLSGGRPKAASDPAGLARQLTVAETAIRDPKTPPDRLRAAAWTAQVAYRALEHRPGWGQAVPAAVPKRLRDVVRHNTAARREFKDMQPSRLPDSLPSWRIVEPLPADRLREIYAAAQRRYGVPWEVLAAIHLVETGTGRIVGTSSAGAQGPMQFMPATWDSYGMGGDVWNTRDAVMAAANYLAANGADSGRLDHALWHYNNDTRYVRAVRHFATVMRDHERAFLGYHARKVYYRTSAGDILLPVGYEATDPIPVQQWLDRPPG
jgi:membrane-bound lytic murein transglycosylase B